MAESFKVESDVGGYNVYNDVWSTAVETTLPCQQEWLLLWKDDLAKSWAKCQSSRQCSIAIT